MRRGLGCLCLHTDCIDPNKKKKERDGLRLYSAFVTSGHSMPLYNMATQGEGQLFASQHIELAAFWQPEHTTYTHQKGGRGGWGWHEAQEVQQVGWLAFWLPEGSGV